MPEQTTVLERFADEYNAVPTNEDKFALVPDENVYVNSNNSLAIGTVFPGRPWKIEKEHYEGKVSLTTVERTHDGRERTFYTVEGEDIHFKESLIEAVSDLFETPVSDMDVQIGEYNRTILIEGPDDLQAIVSPFILY